MKRKDALKLMAAGTVGLGLAPVTGGSRNSSVQVKLKGNINHSACRWCYNKLPLEEFADQSKSLGLSGIDLLGPREWKTVFDRGLACSMANPDEFDLSKGFNDLSLHVSLQQTYGDLIPRAAEAGIKNVICFSGNRNGLDDVEGLENCARGLEPLVKLAEKHNIQLMMELLNSKVDHKDYQCDHTPWGVQLCEKIGSPNFQLLYDIYHMQIMEGDIIATIRRYNSYIGHYHTGGVPGRNEINDSQELNYPAIMKAILETGYKGYVAQEFVPTRDNIIESLKEGVLICDV